MCFAVPVKIKKILPNNQAEVTRGHKKLVLSTQLLSVVKKNDWVLTQANLATEKISAGEAREILRYFKSVQKK